MAPLKGFFRGIPGNLKRKAHVREGEVNEEKGVKMERKEGK